MIIGLTGGISSGKSTVSNLISTIGIPIIDADVIAREVVEPGESAYEQIVAHFGSRVLQEDGTIARKRLGEIIFNDENERTVLNSIVHPAIRKRMLETKDRLLADGYSVVVYDIPLLFESDLRHMVDKILLVYVDEHVQLERLMERDQSTKEEALSRINSQMPLKDKCQLSDEVINNNGSLEETKQQLIDILTKWEVKYDKH
ncbi:dephospho-CoA kinase [Alkalihalophilus pseudofirmus]|uniref:dephospho-CoA kinase n=1 Tax=Alkalihalobacterium alkalinitrilicum TaxID=427920 RepID=UPI00094D2391|nr:dephospho-CoA kinase [Alkalihalobacterium alkalinitrilicum]OLO27848.1 dephospho-CoA kinase [Alkalihalophilus pseudofirmus]